MESQRGAGKRRQVQLWRAGSVSQRMEHLCVRERVGFVK